MGLRERLAELEERFGPDCTELIYRFPDGWEIRQLIRDEDLKREGLLMRNCLGTQWQSPLELYSLRDPPGMPHANFCAWRRCDEHDGPAKYEHPWLDTWAGVFLVGGRAESELKPEYLQRLARFGETPALLFFDVFPPGERPKEPFFHHLNRGAV